MLTMDTIFAKILNETKRHLKPCDLLTSKTNPAFQRKNITLTVKHRGGSVMVGGCLACHNC